MRSEKGITLVALIGIFVLIVVLAGISISIAAKGNNEVQEPENSVVSGLEDSEYEDEELIVDPTTRPETSTDVENTLVENEAVTEADTTNTVANEVEE